LTGSILAIMMGVLLVMTEQTSRLFNGTAAKIEQFQDSRVAFDTLSRRLAGATLNTYLNFQYNGSAENDDNRRPRVPIGFERQSELRFLSGPMSGFASEHPNPDYYRPTHGVFFQAPTGIVSDVAKYGAATDLL